MAVPWKAAAAAATTTTTKINKDDTDPDRSIIDMQDLLRISSLELVTVV